MTSMKKKILLLFLLLFSAFLIIVFSEEKLEYSSEIELWKINFNQLAYTPPREDWQGKDKDKFQKQFLRFTRKGNLFSRYFFTIDSVDMESKEKTIYEGGYNVRNIFTELANPKTRTVIAKSNEGESSFGNDMRKPLVEKLGIDVATSPIVEIGNDLGNKKLYLGNKNSESNRFFLVDNKSLFTKNTDDPPSEKEIYSIHSYIFEKFMIDPVGLRERQLITINDKYINKIEYIKDSQNKTLLNRLDAAKNNENVPVPKSNHWRLKGAGREFSSAKNQEIENAIRAFRVDLYPDEMDGQGFAVAKVLTGLPAVARMKFEISDGTVFAFEFFPPTDIKNVKYFPVIRNVDQKFIESPFYIRKEKYDTLISLFAEEKLNAPEQSKK